jgi:hypothetical protein
MQRYIRLAATIAFVLGPAALARADLIQLLSDRYVARTLVTVTDPGTGEGRAWNDTTSGKAFVPGATNAFTLSTEGRWPAAPDVDPVGDFVAGAYIGLASSPSLGNSWFETHVTSGIVESSVPGPQPDARMNAQLDTYMKFFVQGDQTSLSFGQFGSTSSRIRLVNSTTGAVLTDETHTYLGGRDRWSVPLADAGTYELWTSTWMYDSRGDPEGGLNVFTDADIQPTPVPEPASLLLLASGAGALIRRRVRQKASSGGASH